MATTAKVMSKASAFFPLQSAKMILDSATKTADSEVVTTIQPANHSSMT